MNLVPLRKFNNTEVNLFFTLCNKLKDKGNLTVNVPFEELKEYIESPKHKDEEIVKQLKEAFEIFNETEE